MEPTTAATQALGDAVGTVLEGVTEAGDLVWGIFTPLVNMISENALIFIPVGFAILAGAVGIGIKLIRKFGMRGKR